MLISRTIHFTLERTRASDTFARLRCRVRWGDVSLSVGLLQQQIDPEKWSAQTQRCINKSIHGTKRTPAAQINRNIGLLEEQIERVFYHFEQQEKIPTKTQFKTELEILSGKSPRKRSEAFFAAYDRFRITTSRANDWSLSTVSRFKTLRGYLYEVAPKLTFESYNEELLTSLMVHLRDRKSLRNVTTLKYFAKLRQFTRWALKNGHITDQSLATYSPKMKNPPPPVVYLDWEELMRVYNYEFGEDNEHLDRARDLFCFCCFTSLRYSDMANLTHDSLHDDYISVTTIKTADALRIDLNKYSRAIIDKYRYDFFEKNLLLPVITNQKLNDYLKTIGVMCGINALVNEVYYIGNTRHERTRPKHELLSSHCGRRTFICNALMMGIPVATVMKWTGHSDYKAMKPYIDISDRAKAEAMSRFDTM